MAEISTPIARSRFKLNRNVIALSLYGIIGASGPTIPVWYGPIASFGMMLAMLYLMVSVSAGWKAALALAAGFALGGSLPPALSLGSVFLSGAVVFLLGRGR